jgi:hypothetical protein
LYGLASSSLPSSSAAVNDWPLAWKMRPASIFPSWLMRPSAGITRLRGSASATRAPGFSARVKNWLKVA